MQPWRKKRIILKAIDKLKSEAQARLYIASPYRNDKLGCENLFNSALFEEDIRLLLNLNCAAKGHIDRRCAYHLGVPLKRLREIMRGESLLPHDWKPHFLPHDWKRPVFDYRAFG